MEKSIKVALVLELGDGRKVELAKDEARELYQTLESMFGRSMCVPYVYSSGSSVTTGNPTGDSWNN